MLSYDEKILMKTGGNLKDFLPKDSCCSLSMFACDMPYSILSQYSSLYVDLISCRVLMLGCYHEGFGVVSLSSQTVDWDAIRCDTIRYDTVYLRVLISWQDGWTNLAHGTETKKIRKN